jgi:repressor LexA
MHPIQEKILKLASKQDIAKLSLRNLGSLVEEDHPQKIKHHLSQLLKKGLLDFKSSKTFRQIENGLVAVPILGSADCGPATLFANENIEGYLRISSKLLKFKPGLFALKAVGNSMNEAKVNGNKKIENGDYVIVDSTIKEPSNKDYVVSIIDGMANIKRFIKDLTHKQVVLMSESSHNYPPIYISPSEESYLVNGRVVDVIKKPSLS